MADAGEEGRSGKRLRVEGMEGAGHGADSAEYHMTHDQFKMPGLLCINHTFQVPLDHHNPSGPKISVFARELVSPQHKASTKMPYLVFLQGGPGFEAVRPTEASIWIKSAVNLFRVILLDQRGTGRSTPITTFNLQKQGTPEQQAAYLAHFRADSIVLDAELVRKALVPKDSFGGRWSVLGQSFGGFCAATYLSLAPQGLLEVLMTGGLPPAIASRCSADDVYTATSRHVVAANKKYYARFPQDVAHVQRIVLYLASQPEGGVRLPSGSLLTPRAFQTLGLSGLGSGGGFERLHYLLEHFFDDGGDITPTFAKGFESWQSWDTNPLYALLHESIYCQGAASNWSAERVRSLPDFKDAFDALASAQAGRPVYFTGEMVYPWMFDDFAALRPYKATAQLLADKSDWGQLYNSHQLGLNTVPVAALSYVEDLYVDFALARETAGAISGLKHWCTNEYRHSGIRDDGARIFDRLLGMVRDSVFD